jgi:hypothetical protein
MRVIDPALEADDEAGVGVGTDHSLVLDEELREFSDKVVDVGGGEGFEDGENA